MHIKPGRALNRDCARLSMGYVAFAWLVEIHRRIAPYRCKSVDNASCTPSLLPSRYDVDVRKAASVLITDGPIGSHAILPVCR